MITIDLRQFGGNGASSGGGGGGGGGKGSSGGQKNGVSLPKHLDEDVVRTYEIQIKEGKKLRKEIMFATAWQVKQKELDFVEKNLGMNQKEYLRQNKYSFTAYRQYKLDRFDMPIEKYNKNADAELEKRLNETYKKDKKAFAKRLRKFTKGK